MSECKLLIIHGISSDVSVFIEPYLEVSFTCYIFSSLFVYKYTILGDLEAGYYVLRII